MATNSHGLNHYESSAASDSEQGYDSEAAEISKSSRPGVVEQARKRRKVSHTLGSQSEESSESEPEETVSTVRVRDKSQAIPTASPVIAADKEVGSHENGSEDGQCTLEPSDHTTDQTTTAIAPTNHDSIPSQQGKKKRSRKKTTPGVVYLSSLPPYLRPSALRNLVTARGFSPITRLFLTPASASATSKQSRQRYTEGWIEFPSKHIAKECVAALNAQPVGGKKSGYYRDDLWNMRYLRGLSWEELMEGVRGERREREAREDEERRKVKQESERFIEAVEKGKVQEGIKAKRKQKDVVEEDTGKQRWRQHQVKRKDVDKDEGREIDEEAQEVLAKIF